MSVRNLRFSKRLDPHALRFSSSLPIDQRLFREDIKGSVAHVRMLAKQKIIPSGEARMIERALRRIEKEIASGEFSFGVRRGSRSFADEDIHMAIERRLIEIVGVTGGKLHTARSRNDQVALDERLFLRTTISDILKLIRQLQRTCLEKAEKHPSLIMPGYTHLQRAQPILLAHHLLAYVSMLERDYERFTDCRVRVSRSPLGAAALAGTSFPIDRRAVARTLGFEDLIVNSIDAVSDRDVQIEFLSCCSIAMMHLSRFAEELVLWSSEEWNFAGIGDAFTTGSSIMPQKKNPDIAELIRGKTGRVYGNLVALLTVMKGLPLTYNRDMQEDKEPLFNSADTAADCLSLFSKMLKTVKFNSKRFDGSSDFFLATELADYLVRKGLPFRRAHAIVAGIVRDCIRRKTTLAKLPLTSYRDRSKFFEQDLWKVLSIEESIKLKKSEGSTSPHEVRKAIQFWRKRVE